MLNKNASTKMKSEPGEGKFIDKNKSEYLPRVNNGSQNKINKSVLL